MNYLRVYLKICEGCGVLWLRSGSLDGIYCRKCEVVLSDFPAPHAGKCSNRRSVSSAVKTSVRKRCTAVRGTGSANSTLESQPLLDFGGDL